MEYQEEQRSERPNSPTGRKDPVKDLDALTADELAEALEATLESMSEDDYDQGVIEAYLDALDKKAPMPEMPDVEEAYADFQAMLRSALPGEKPEDKPDAAAPRRPRGRRLSLALRVALVAACVFACLMVAQAAGLDVFGAMARWTESVFSFGTVRGTGAGDVPEERSLGEAGDELFQDMLIAPVQMESKSVQDILNEYGVTGVCEPEWLARSCNLNELSVVNSTGSNHFILNAVYVGYNGIEIGFDIVRYTGEPTIQAEKTSRIVDIFEYNGTEYYLIENSKNYTVAWLAGSYECYVSADDKDVLLEMVGSLF